MTIRRLLDWWRGVKTLEPVKQEVLQPLPRPPGSGWALWMYDPPYRYNEVETWHENWGNKIAREDPHAMHPSRNIAGLWWRPVGQIPF